MSKKKTAKARVLKSKTVFRGPVFSVMSDFVEEPTGVRARRDVVRHPGSVVVLAVDKSGRTPRILLERQFRYCANRFLWELPAGTRDPGETELAGARRELLEETGYKATTWRRIFKFYVSPGFVDETMAIFLAQGLIAGPAQPEEDERIECRMVPLPEASKMIARGTICDAKTIAGVLWLSQQRPTRAPNPVTSLQTTS
jgi:ADP-ribose pyrophosphatase